MRPDCSTALTQVRSRRGRNRSLPYSLSVSGAHRRRAAMSTTISSNRPGGGIKWRWPSVHPEGRKFLLIAAIVTLCFWLLGWPVLPWLMLGLTIWVGAFFRDPVRITPTGADLRSAEHTSELQSLMRISYAVFCLNKKT